MNKLKKSKKQKIIAGVLGGISKSIHFDPTITRIIFAIIALATSIFPSIVIYLVAAMIMPEDDSEFIETEDDLDNI